MRDSFRPAGALKEFYGELDGLKKSQSQIVVWQTDKSGERNQYNGMIKSYLANKTQTVINLTIPGTCQFDDQSSIFIYEEIKGILFKGQYEHFVNGNLKLIADDRVFLKEKRNCQRVVFQYTKVSVDLKYGQTLDLNKQKLKDISKFGFGILVSEKIAKGLKLELDLNIKSINGIEMPVSLEGEIVHKTCQDRKNGIYIIGVKFKSESKLISKVISTLEKSKTED